MLSFNPGKGPSLIPLAVYSNIRKPGYFPSLEESTTPKIVLSMRPSVSPVDVPTGNILEFPSGLSTLMPYHFHSGEPTVPQIKSPSIMVSFNPNKGTSLIH